MIITQIRQDTPLRSRIGPHLLLGSRCPVWCDFSMKQMMDSFIGALFAMLHIQLVSKCPGSLLQLDTNPHFFFIILTDPPCRNNLAWQLLRELNHPE